MRSVRSVIALVVCLFAANVAAQQRPGVEVASIKRNMAGRGPLPPNVLWLSGDRMSATGLTLAELIRSAYVGDGIQLMNQIVGGPAWINSDRFDIVGKLTGVTAGSPDEANRQRQTALKALLSDRFKLRLHTDRRDLPVFDLVLANKDGRLGPQIKASTCTRVGDRPCVPFRMMSMSSDTGMTMRTEGVTMREFAAAIVSFPEIGRTIRDRTGLTGTYDLQVTLPMPTPGAVSDSGIVTALLEQLGLRLAGRRDLADVVVIAGAEPPTED
jgi:uncharacterized protein (TIGR03435 family)